MANITAKEVAALRAKTGIGMMECKKALVEANGDMDAAIKVLRERGLAVAAKKADRIAADGIVDIMQDGDTVAMIEVNSETDFVAKNESFQVFVSNILKSIIKNKPANIDELMASTYIDSNITLEAKLHEMMFTIGEKISIRRFVIVNGLTSTYIHGKGSIGVVVKFETDAEIAKKDEFAEFGKNIALQIAAYNVAYLDKESVPANVLAEEKAILMAQIKNDASNAKKPDNIIEKMIVGRLGKFYENNCVIEQDYIKDDDIKVSKYIENTEKALGGKIKVAGFVRYEKGEGIQKREEDFAAEIAKLTNN